MPISLPRPQYILPFTADNSSGRVVAIIYENYNLTHGQYHMLCQQVSSEVSKALMEYKELEDGTLIEVVLPSSSTDELPAQYIQLVMLLDPVYLPCGLEVHIANDGQAALLVVSVVAPQPRITADMGTNLALALRGLGGMVTYRPDLPAASQGNSFAIAVSPFYAPRDLKSFLSDTLREAGLGHVYSEVKHVSMQQYVFLTIRAITFG